MNALLAKPTRAETARVRGLLEFRRLLAADNRKDRAYVTYVICLVSVMYVPTGLLVFRRLVSAWHAWPASTIVPFLAGVAAVAVLLIGGVPGPVSTSLANVDVVLTSAWDRTAFFQRRLMATALGLGSAAAVAFAALDLQRVARSTWDPTALVIDGLSGLGFGLGLCIWWLASELVFNSRRKLFWLSACLLAILLGMFASISGIDSISAFAPITNPAAWASSVFRVGSVATEVAIALPALFAEWTLFVILSRVVPRLVNREYLYSREISRRAARQGLVTMNPRAVSEAIVHKRFYFRNLTLIRGAVSPIVARDFLGLLRRWPRALFGILCASVGSVLVLSSWPTPVASSPIAAILMTFAAGLLSGGLKSHADNVGRDGTLEPQNVRSLAWHLVVPTVLMLLATAVATVVTLRIDMTSIGRVLLLGCLAIVSLSIQGVSAYSNQLPYFLIGPVITPLGDISFVVMVSWLLRTYLFAALVAWISVNIELRGSWTQQLVAAFVSVIVGCGWSWMSGRREWRTNFG